MSFAITGEKFVPVIVRRETPASPGSGGAIDVIVGAGELCQLGSKIDGSGFFVHPESIPATIAAPATAKSKECLMCVPFPLCWSLDGWT
jgi:hypothetical protein